MIEITKKFVMIDAKVEGEVLNLRYDSIKVSKETMKEAIMSYLKSSLDKSKEINRKYDEFKASIVGNPTEAELKKSEEFIFLNSDIMEKQKVLVIEKLKKADNTKKILIHSKANYYLKLSNEVDGNFQSDYYFTLDGLPIDDVYTYFLEKIN